MQEVKPFDDGILSVKVTFPFCMWLGWGLKDVLYDTIRTVIQSIFEVGKP